MTAAIKRWEEFRERVERKGLKSYESLRPFPYPMKLWFGGGRPTRMFYFTKPAFIDSLGRRSLFPEPWLAIERHSIPTPEAIATLHMLVKGFRLPLVFVGDLVPDLPTLVGPRSWDLLKSGHDVMIEMTYNAGGYRKGYLEHLIAHLDAIAARANRRSTISMHQPP